MLLSVTRSIIAITQCELFSDDSLNFDAKFELTCVIDCIMTVIIRVNYLSVLPAVIDTDSTHLRVTTILIRPLQLYGTSQIKLCLT